MTKSDFLILFFGFFSTLSLVMALYFPKARPILINSGFLLFFLGLFFISSDEFSQTLDEGESSIWNIIIKRWVNVNVKSRRASVSPIIALASDSPEQIILKMGCASCHQIPGIPWSKGVMGPILIEKTLAQRRISSAEYQSRVKAGKAHANSAKEYIIESIISPDNFIVPEFETDSNSEHSIMYHGYEKKFTYGALDNLADYLLTLDCESAKRDNLEGPPQEKVSRICG